MEYQVPHAPKWGAPTWLSGIVNLPRKNTWTNLRIYGAWFLCFVNQPGVAGPLRGGGDNPNAYRVLFGSGCVHLWGFFSAWVSSNGQQCYGVLRSSYRGYFAGYYPLTSDVQSWNLTNNLERVHGCVHGRANFVLQSTDLTDGFHMGTYLGRLLYRVQRTLHARLLSGRSR
jgi:hypothetical protein